MRFRHTLDQFVGRPRWVTVLGTATVLAYAVAVFYAGGLEVGGDVTFYAAGLVGGLVAGFALGTNVYDGMAAGLRAGAFGVVTLAVAATAAFFVLWQAASGQLFFYWASFYGLLGLIFLAPIYGFTGILGGAVGVLLRRWTLPDHLNPRAY
ncbi:DUF5518 domain-containing protein [Haloarcula marina]|uniref:DUF5518 domain-containing protein n=1 Tax=Haloarcula marina TaxID=2961574 RepID=UPI0020B667EE|nr:DUF5518 domain-containing protein [Halomicroarcula marina]